MTKYAASHTAPTNLKMPDYVPSWVGNRQERILDHGFEAKGLALDWWNSELAAAGLGRFTVTVDPNRRGAEKLTRGELFELGSHLSEDDDAVLNFLWHVLAWGSGTSHRQNRKRITSLADNEHGADYLKLLREAAQISRDGGSEAARDAYGVLIRKGGGVIPGLGPAFFTKFLYFAGGAGPDESCLILDARVAGSLFKAGWTDLPSKTTKKGLGFSYNWYTDTYVSYCETLARWTKESGAEAPDEIERALFEGDPRE